MTIALGILASDGIVLAADTEVTWGDARKTEGTKIAVAADLGLAIAGAGRYGYMEALFYELQQAVLHTSVKSVPAIGRVMQATLERFHRKHIQPWNDPALDVWLLIALERGGRRALWVTDKTTLTPCVCAAIGIGSAEADALFVEFFGPNKTPALDAITARGLAAYIAHVAKDRIPGCGKNTDIALVSKGAVEQLSRAEVAVLEYHIEDLLDLQTQAARFALGYLAVKDEEQAGRNLAVFYSGWRRNFREGAHTRIVSKKWIL